MKIYFLGISGTFMGNLAQIAKAQGHEVIGCDNKVYPPMSDELNSSGINFFQGYEEKNFVDADIYVIGNAISKENTVLKEILRLKKKIISGPEWLYENILQNKKVIAVSGTHGKTTVTSMIAHSLVDNNFDPNYLIAGIPKKLDKSWKEITDVIIKIMLEKSNTITQSNEKLNNRTYSQNLNLLINFILSGKSKTPANISTKEFQSNVGKVSSFLTASLGKTDKRSLSLDDIQSIFCAGVKIKLNENSKKQAEKIIDDNFQ